MRLTIRAVTFAVGALFFSEFLAGCEQLNRQKKDDNLIRGGDIVSKNPLGYADSLFQLGKAYYSKSEKERALKLYEEALALREQYKAPDSTLLRTYESIGRIYYREFKFNAADNYFEKARKLTSRIQIPFERKFSLLLMAVVCKRELKDFALSLSLSHQLLEFTKQEHPDDLMRISRCYYILGSIHHVENNFDSALVKYELAIKTVSKVKPTQETGLFYPSVALIFAKQKKFSDALKYLDKSIAHTLKWTTRDSDPMAILYMNKADVHRQLRQFDSASYFLRRTLAIRKQLYGEKNVNVFGAYLDIGNLSLELGETDSAMFYYQRSIVSLVDKFNETDWRVNPQPKFVECNSDLVLGLLAKAKAIKIAATRDTSSDTTRLSFALKTYLLADSVFGVFRRNILSDEPQIAQMESLRIPYEEMLVVAHELYLGTKSERYLETVLNIMEKSRAVLLQEALAGAQAYGEVDLPEELRQQERTLVHQRTEIIRLLEQKGNPKNLNDSLERHLVIVNDQQEEIKEAIALKKPGYFQIKYLDKKISLNEAKDIAKREDALFLEYFWGKENVFMLGITERDIKLKVIPTRDLTDDLDQLRQELSQGTPSSYNKSSFQQFCNNANQLYTHLLGDWAEEKKRIIVSPDGPLTLLPFEVLISEPVTFKGEVDYHVPYVLQSHSFCYVNSLNLLDQYAYKRRRGASLLALGYGGDGTTLNDRDTGTDLPGTASEIEAIKALMHNGQNRYYLADEASEARFKQEIKGFNIAHLALHGVADTVSALQSKIIFREQAGSAEDGSLYAHEVYDLPLENLDLAVLSACESGIGKHQTGEGVMSIARGFAYAGCPTTVMSLWRVNDKAAAILMERFYQHLSDGQPIDKAIAQAKRDWLANANELNAHPSNWAAFLLMGDNRPILKRKSNRWGWILLLLCAGSMLILLIVKLRK